MGRNLTDVLLDEKRNGIKGGVYNKFQVDFAYNSSHIEGSRGKGLYEILDFHAEFERIHPFYDGNGRIGRLLMFKECLKNGIVPFFIEDTYKGYYYRGLKEWQNGGEKGYLVDTCLAMQDKMRGILDYFRIDYDRTEFSMQEILKGIRTGG